MHDISIAAALLVESRDLSIALAMVAIVAAAGSRLARACRAALL